MSEIFLKIINMSISASYIVLAVLLLRLFLKKAPKWITVLLWGIVAVRLICPFSMESVFSLIPSAEVVSPNIMMEKTPTINTGIPMINSTLNPVISESLTPNPGDSANPLQIWIPVLTTIWIVGMAALLIYTVISYAKVRCKIGTAVLYRDNIYQSENVVSPFVLGLINPKIYLPFNMNEKDMEHVVAHEMAHIRRKDHFWKPLGFLLLTLHWFNPLMWLGYVLLCRDIELACDEKVIKALDHDARADYSEALLACSVNRRMIAACPLAFGEVSVKDRVKSVLNYKKPAFWIIVVAVIACIAVAVCFLTNPVGEMFTGEVELFIYYDTPTDVIEQLHSDREDRTVNVLFKSTQSPKDVTLEFFCRKEWSFGEWEKTGEAMLSLGETASFDLPAHHVYKIVSMRHSGYNGNAVFEISYDNTTHGNSDDATQIVYDDKKQITLTDVITLSAKGYDLTWEDFYEFKSIETGSGLYIRVYEIDENFSLWIGGGAPIGTPMYIRLKCNDVDVYADVTKDDIAAFIEMNTKEGPILFDRPISYYIDLAWAEAEPIADEKGYVVQRSDVTITHDNDGTITVIFKGSDGIGGWSEIHVALVPQSDGGYGVDASLTTATSHSELLEEEEAAILDAIREQREQEEAILDAIREQREQEEAILEAIREQKEQEEAIVKAQVQSKILNLFIVIESSPTSSSNPQDYINAHPNEFNELMSYGNNTLVFIFNEFLSGEQTGLHGNIMCTVMLNLLNDNEIITYDPTNGQDYFDHWLKSARSVGQQHDPVWLEVNVPAIALVLRMTGDISSETYVDQPEVDPYPAETAISRALNQHYHDDEPTGVLHGISYVIIGNEELSGTPLHGKDGHIQKEIYYLLVMHQKYSMQNGEPTAISGSYIPTVLTFTKEDNGEYILDEYWEPRDGAYYDDDIKVKFPAGIIDEVWNMDAYSEKLEKQCADDVFVYVDNHQNYTEPGDF